MIKSEIMQLKIQEEDLNDARKHNNFAYFIAYQYNNKLNSLITFYSKEIDCTEDICALTDLLNTFHKAEGDIIIINFIKLKKYE
jgi:peroxiredoxin